MTTFEPGSIIQLSLEEMQNIVNKLVQPTCNLRFIVRNGEKVLQQQFEITVFKGNKEVGWESDWRDVPFIENP